MKREGAISEIIGAILLVAIVIAGIGIVGVFMTSTPPPHAGPKAVLSSSCIDCTKCTDTTLPIDPSTCTGAFVIVVRHEGGDLINPKFLDYNLRSEYANGTPITGTTPVNGTRFYLAEEFSGFSKEDICSLPAGSIAYGDATRMINGDAITIWYRMVNP